MGEHAECAIAAVSLPTPTPSRLPSSPRHTRNSHVCNSQAPCTGRGGRRRHTGRGGGLVGCKGEGAPHSLPPGSHAVSLTLPAHRGCTASLLLPSPICWGCVLPTHPHPPPPEAAHFPVCARDRAPSPSATGVARCFSHPSQGCPPRRLPSLLEEMWEFG